MTLLDQQAHVISWTEPEGIGPRGALIVFPGRGERPEVYERFGRRVASDGYRVHVVSDPAADAALTESRAVAVAEAEAAAATEASPPSPRPLVLVGSDTGALFAAGLAASGRFRDVDALVLAGLPVAETDALDAGAAAGSWDDELAIRTSCPTHRGKLAGPVLRRGAIYDPLPDGWTERADLAAISQPVLGIHGVEDQISPLPAARAQYAAAPHAELVSIVGGVHDALNDITHRTVAATVVLFLERLRLGADVPLIAVQEKL